MQRKIYLFCLALAMICSVSHSYAQRGKSELAVGYGYHSLYGFVNGRPYDVSSGTSVFTYRYYVSRDVTLGMAIGYENIKNWGSFVSFVPELTVAYMDTRKDRVRVKLYGAFSYGVSVFSDAITPRGQADESGLKPWAFQATPIGVRLGRQYAAFLEVGFGYKGLIHGGLALRVPRVLHHRERVD